MLGHKLITCIQRRIRENANDYSYDEHKLFAESLDEVEYISITRNNSTTLEIFQINDSKRPEMKEVKNGAKLVNMHVFKHFSLDFETDDNDNTKLNYKSSPGWEAGKKVSFHINDYDKINVLSFEEFRNIERHIESMKNYANTIKNLLS